VVLSAKYPNIKSSLLAALQVPGKEKVTCASPERIINMVCKTVTHNNVASAERLNSIGVNMDVVLNAIHVTASSISPEIAPIDYALLTNLISLFASQLQELNIDPKIYRQDETWHLITVTGRSLLNSYVSRGLDEKRGNQGHDQYYHIILAVLSIIQIVITGARSLGTDLQEHKHYSSLIGYGTGTITDLCLQIHHVSLSFGWEVEFYLLILSKLYMYLFICVQKHIHMQRERGREKQMHKCCCLIQYKHINISNK
jgi:hypothetical protein